MTMACDDYYYLGTQLPSLAWNLDDLGALAGAEFGSGLGILNEHVSLVMQPPETAELSTGYLEDAVAQWSDRCKRRRTLHFPHDPAAMEDVIVEDLVQGFWNSNCHFDTFAAGLNGLTENNIVTASDEPSLSSITMKEAATTEERNGFKLVSDQEHVSSSSTSSSSSCKDVSAAKADVRGKRTTASRPTPPPFSSCFPTASCLPAKECREDTQPKKKKVTTRVVYPFAVVRPGGVDGGVTLKDINRRLLMRPTRPVRHPVGEFACLPCVSGDGPGLSGKAVVGITRIQTQGRGTITIIRTKG